MDNNFAAQASSMDNKTLVTALQAASQIRGGAQNSDHDKPWYLTATAAQEAMAAEVLRRLEAAK